MSDCVHLIDHGSQRRDNGAVRRLFEVYFNDFLVLDLSMLSQHRFSNAAASPQGVARADCA